MQEKIAIIGTGIAGMGIAHFLNEHYDLTLFEKNDYIGGHTNTVDVEEDGKQIPIDTGFIVFNDVTYPNLIKLFAKLSVPVKNSNMSFSVQHIPSGLEFCGSGIDGLFVQRKNFFSPRYLRLLYNINRFNQESIKILNDKNEHSLTLKEFIDKFHYHPDLLEYYLVPMSSAVWSTPINKMMDFPALTLIRFFYNHGFLGLNTQHQWKTVVNGSRSYVQLITKPFLNKIRLKSGVKKVTRLDKKVKIVLEDGSLEFDKVIFACHADTTMKLMENPTEKEKNLLKLFRYEKNIATLHTDSSLMPKHKKAWSAWNYRVEKKSNGDWQDSNLVYWMNALQGVSNKKDYFVSINDPGLIQKEKILKVIEYDHPLFDVHTQKAQEELPSLNQNSRFLFCGSYFRYGFHEDAFASSVQLASQILGKDVWN